MLLPAIMAIVSFSAFMKKWGDILLFDAMSWDNTVLKQLPSRKIVKLSPKTQCWCYLLINNCVFNFASELWQLEIMHARWDFDASRARTRRVSALA